MSEDAPPRKTPVSKAVLPVAMMVALFILTIGLALVVAPLYLRQGLQAFGEEGAKNPLIAVYYLVMIIFVTVVILLLRKFLKRRRRNFLKYVLGAAVLLSTYAVIWPLLTAAIHGLPPEWEESTLSLSNPIDAIAPDVLVYPHGFGILEGGGLVRIVHADNASTFRSLGGSVIERTESSARIWMRGTPFHVRWEIPLSEDEEITSISPIEDDLAMTIVKGNSSSIKLLIEGSSTTVGSNSTYDLHFVSGTDLAYSGPILYRFSIENTTFNLTLEPYHTFDRDILWARSDGVLLVSTAGGPFLEDDEMVQASDTRFDDPSLVSLAYGPEGWEIAAVRGGNLFIITQEGTDIWYLSGDDVIMVHHNEPGGVLTFVSGRSVETGTLPKSYNTAPMHIASFAMASGLVVLLFIKPKWYIVDLAGILMGAGVLSLIGISLSILPLILLLVLLAVYDFISVYKTKHMLTLAESVVESKLPILLVFPMKPSYRYEEEKDLLDRSKPRQAMFMGLGDVIIPGTLIVSASTFLAGRGGASVLGMPPQMGVALFALAGLFVGFSGLMYLVLKGKAHAGLPLLNSGTILGFLLGELLFFGRIILL
ncbi:MAG: presenilin family intramembrane aspartyl protease [Candidatus Thermoplasmatota archaeon]|nr:presenilin family intramembrane aspartyl protease [Candidatus Thermoplasmatota archaeon]